MSSTECHGITRLASAAVLLACTVAAVAAPQIDSLSRDRLARSGRLEIYGTGFGDAQAGSEVMIGGLPAIATTWSDSEIHAYVPERASLGAASVSVVTSDGESDALPITITTRVADGRVSWRFQMDSPICGQFTAVGEDGTIYATDNERMYALSADGGLRWVQNQAGSVRPISIASDGTIFVAVELPGPDKVTAVNPDGTIRWDFPLPSSSPFLAGPNVGPDDNVYAVQATIPGGPELGVFSLDPSGDLLWSDWGAPAIFSSVGSNSAIKFGTDRMYFGIVVNDQAPPSLRAFDLAGEQLWYSGDLLIPGGTFPQLDPFGRVIYRRAQTGMQAITPDGDVDWASFHPSGVSVLEMPAVGPDGVVYTGDFLGIDLWAINPDGSTKWVLPSDTGQLLAGLAVAPDNSVVLAPGNQGFGQPHWFRAYATDDGSVQWQVDLPNEGGVIQFVHSMEQTFSPSGRTMYFNTRFGSDANPAYLYAMNVGDEVVAGDIDGDGDVDLADLATLLAAYGTCAGDSGYDPDADLDAGGCVDLADLAILLAHYGS